MWGPQEPTIVCTPRWIEPSAPDTCVSAVPSPCPVGQGDLRKELRQMWPADRDDMERCSRPPPKLHFLTEFERRYPELPRRGLNPWRRLQEREHLRSSG